MPKKTKLPSVWQLITITAKNLIANPKLLWLVAVILVPTTLISAGSGSEGSTIGSIAAILMNLALIWAIIEIGHNRRITIKDAYFKGTAAFVQFMLVALLLVIMLLPLLGGLLITGVGILPAQALIAERVLLGIVSLVLIAPTVYWLSRYVFALFIVCESDTGPIQALKTSGKLVKGRWLAVTGRLAVIAVAMALVGSAPLLLLAVTKGEINQVWIISLQLLSGVLGLPYLNLYLHNLYRSLNGQKISS